MRFRVMTYNVRHCRGPRGRPDPSRIADVIAEHAPDVAALQELDVRNPRTGLVDQPRAIAEALRMEHHFCAAVVRGELHYGHALLSRYPLTLVRSALLPAPPLRPELEPRAALWATADVDGTAVQMISTHLGLAPDERRMQIEALFGGDWLDDARCTPPVVLLGDFNSVPRSAAYRRLASSRLRDAALVARAGKPRPTFPSLLPLLRIDHVFVSAGVSVHVTRVPKSTLVRSASDHRPVVVDLEIDVARVASAPAEALP